MPRFVDESTFFSALGRLLSKATPVSARAAIGAASVEEMQTVVVDAVAAAPTVIAAAAEAVTAELADREVVEGKVYTTEEDWLAVFVDNANKVLGGFRKSTGYFDDFSPIVTEVLDWEGSEWAIVFTDADDKIMGGWLKTGAFVNYGEDAQVGQVSAWPAVAYGDSTTFGADLSNPTTERWTTLLSTALGKTIQNYGSSGARAEEIVARQGGITFAASVAGNQIPASGAVVLTSLEVDPVRSGDITSYTVEIAGVRGLLARSGSDRTFTRTAAGSAVTVPAVVDVQSVTGEPHRESILFLGMGINNEGLIAPPVGDPTQTVDQLCAWYTSATSWLTPTRPRFVIWGMLDRGPTEAAGTPNGNIIAAVETFLAKTYGSDFVNVRKYLASTRALAEVGITPTADDTAAIAAGTVPPSLRVSSGSVHLNAAGHQVMANVLKRHLTRKGWI